MSKVSVDVNEVEVVIKCLSPLTVASDRDDEIMIILQPEKVMSNPIVVCLDYIEAIGVFGILSSLIKD